MKDLIAVTNLTMSSLEIAKLTGKNHKEVLRDVRSTLEGLGNSFAQFCAAYKDSSGKKTQGRPAKEYAISLDMAKELSIGEVV